jgi:hypothetical protein
MFCEQIMAQAEAGELLSKEKHFSTDGTLLDAAASIKSFKRKDTVGTSLSCQSFIQRMLISPGCVILRMISFWLKSAWDGVDVCYIKNYCGVLLIK